MFSHYLTFNRNCAEALAVYAEAFGAEIVTMEKYGDIANPGFPMAEADKGLVLHSCLQWEDSLLMCADSAERIQPGSNMYIAVTVKDQESVERAWNMLKQNAVIYMDLAPTFFALLHGSLRDRFGVNWMFTVEK